MSIRNLSVPATGTFVAVTRERFFAVIGPMNVHPRVVRFRDEDGTYNPVSDWDRLDTRATVGRTEGSTMEGSRTYMLASHLA